MSALLLTMLIALRATPATLPREDEGLQHKLGKLVEGYALSEKTFPVALIRVAQDFEIPMGLEWIRLPSDPTEIKRTWHNATVGQIIGSIVKGRAGYDLTVKDGVVHVFYDGATADKRNFLNIKIEDFRSKDEYVAASKQRLHEIVRRIVFPPPPPVPGRQYTEIRQVVVSGGEHKTTFEVLNGTVREVLDKMALATDGKIWVVTFDEKAGLTPTGFRRTISSLWNAYSLPDRYQPAWDFVFVRGTVRGISLPP